MNNTHSIPARPDVVVVGGGIAGGAISVVLARAGLGVVMLEKTSEHKDVVRGEWLAPWGVLEANRLGLTELLVNEGAHRIDAHITYSPFVSRAQAEANALSFVDLAPEKPLCLGHPRTCNLFNREAERLGVAYLRGIQALQISAGESPQVNFTMDGTHHELRPRLVIGADGRSGIVARQLGCTTSHDPEHHLFSGMLVADAPDWPENLQVIASEDDVHVLAFPQGDGKVRIYLGWPSHDRTRLLGPQGPRHFLNSWNLECVPMARSICQATPVSPCIAYPNFDAWLDRIVHPGVVLIGDAAGRNDPIIGQGLSITLRDVRQVSEALLGNDTWSESIFDGYVEERRERMRRLRITARLTSLREAAFGPEGHVLRERIHQRVHANPDFALPFAAAFVGPDALPAEAFADGFTEQVVGAPIWQENLP